MYVKTVISLLSNCRNRVNDIDRRAFLISAIFGIAFGMGLGTGYSADRYETVFPHRLSVVLVTGLLIIVSATALYLILTRSRTHSFRISDEVLPEHLHAKRTFAYQIIILMCWLPVFLGVYPGFFVYDAVDEVRSVFSGVYTTHHPILHTFLLGESVCFGGRVLQNYNYGIAIYIVLQMLIASFIFARVVVRIGRGRLIALAWYGLFPTVVMFALCSVKDTAFALAILCVAILIRDILDQNMRNDQSVIRFLILNVALTLMMLFRNNGIYMFVIFAVCVSVYMMVTHHAFRRQMLICLVTAGFMYVIINSALFHLADAYKDGVQEVLTVPIQQLAHTYSEHRDELSDDEKATVKEIIPVEFIDAYRFTLSDPVKMGFDNEAFKSDPDRYISVWAKLFARYPKDYIDAWIGTCYGFFYPFTVVNVYEGNTEWTFTYTESSYFGYETEYPGERHSLIPVIDRFYRWLSLDDDIQRIPVLSLPFSMGVMFWVYALCLAYLIYRRKYSVVLGLVLPFSGILTFLLGPTFLPRYTVFWWFMFPWTLNYLRE